MEFKAIIFDFDGVIADSEALTNTVMAETVSALGLATTMQDAINRYMGKRWPDVIAIIEGEIGRQLPDDFVPALRAATMQRFREELREVPGAASFIGSLGDLPRAIASSSSMDRLTVCLNHLRLEDAFEGTVFSADLVERGKPYPDIYLHAANQLGIEPGHCLVIEDSASGVLAGKAAGMTVVGLCAASHLTDGHAERMLKAGADDVVESWRQMAQRLKLEPA